MFDNLSRGDVLFVGAVLVVFVFVVVVPAIRRKPDDEILAEPSPTQRWWRRPPG